MELFFIVLILVLWGFLAGRDFTRATLVLPFGFALYLWRFEVLGVPFTMIEALVYVTFLVFLLRLVMRQEKWRWQKWYGAVALILIGATLSLVTVPPEGLRAALGIVKGWLVSPLLFGTMWLVVLRRAENFYRGFNFYLAGAAVLALMALYQVFSGNFITIDGRASGPFQSANYLAFYLVPAVIFALVWLRRRLKSSFWQRLKSFFSKAMEHREHVRLFGLTLLVLILVLALVFTASYAAWIGVLAGLVFYFWTRKPKFTRRHLIAALVGVVILAVIFLSQIGTPKFQAFLDFSEQSSSSVRIEIWRTAGFLLKQSPFLGIGPGQFEGQYQLQAVEALGHEPYEATALHPHNLFLTFWLYTGLIGLAGLIWLLIEAYARIRKRKVNDRQILLISLAILTAILVHGLFDTPFWKNDLAYLWWLVFGGIFRAD